MITQMQFDIWTRNQFKTNIPSVSIFEFLTFLHNTNKLLSMEPNDIEWDLWYTLYEHNESFWNVNQSDNGYPIFINKATYFLKPIQYE